MLLFYDRIIATVCYFMLVCDYAVTSDHEQWEYSRENFYTGLGSFEVMKEETKRVCFGSFGRLLFISKLLQVKLP